MDPVMKGHIVLACVTGFFGLLNIIATAIVHRLIKNGKNGSE